MGRVYPLFAWGKPSLVSPVAVAVVLAGVAGAAVTGVLFNRHRRDTGAPQLPHDNSRVKPATPDAKPQALALVPAMGAAVGVGVVGIGVLTALIERKTVLVEWDDSIEHWASDHADSTSTDLLRAITHLGDTSTVVTLAVLVALLAYLSSRRLGLVPFLAMVVLGQWVLVNAIKWAVARARPSLDPLSSFSGQSFPSGHTTAAAATYVALALVLGLFVGVRGRAVLMGIAVAIAVAVGSSRALLGVHWFSDVVGGLILGWAWFAACSVLFGGRRFHFGAAVEDAEQAKAR